MSQLITSESCCKALLEQGANKGKQCDRPPQDNGYCGKHQKNAELSIAFAEGKRKCSTVRCNNTFIPTSSKKIEYCEDCKKEKEKVAKGDDRCKTEGCSFKAKEEGYCLKHEPGALLLKEAESKGIRICDDGKRKCKNETFNNRLKCEECLAKMREKERGQYESRKEDMKCTMCGIKLEKLTSGIRGHEVQKCQSCYDKTRTIEDARERSRNFKAENLLNPNMHYKQVMDSASKRMIQFNISLELFTEIVKKPCVYCEYYNEFESNGIDRINSSIGYIESNIVSCCENCNRSKGELSVEDFEDYILRIANKIQKRRDAGIIIESSTDTTTIKPSFMRLNKIYELYIHGKFSEYVNICKIDERSPIFIGKLEEILKMPKLEVDDFRRILKNAQHCENRSINLTEYEERKRIPRKLLIQLMDMKKYDEIVDIYSKTFNHEPELKSDLEIISLLWDSYDISDKLSSLEKLIIKYQNKRNRSHLTKSEK